MKIWEKGISIDKKIEHFTIGNDRDLDFHLAKYDIQASIAHVHMLQKTDLITPYEAKALEDVLQNMQVKISNGDFIIEESFEDVHSKIEYDLIKVLGVTGKKIHTGRSRNDQVLVATLLFFKDHIIKLKAELTSVILEFLTLAEKHKNAFLPGYTHLQVAMPSSFGLWFSGYAEMLIDDLYMIQAAIKTVDQNPLGSAAGFGTSFPIDRNFTTQALGFSSLKINVIAAQLSREKTARTVSMALASVALTLGKFAMDICLYMSQNFNYIGLPDSLTTGSSIMPHKKNPDIFEVMRANCNKIQASIYEHTLLSNNLPSGYHRDYQLLKEGSIRNMLLMRDVVSILQYTLPKIQIKKIDITHEAYKYINSVDAINELIMQGKSFRESYQIIGKQIQEGSYHYKHSQQHTHLGSKDNLGIEEIKKKLLAVNIG